MGLLSQSQKDTFWNDGVLIVEGREVPAELRRKQFGA